MYREGVRNEKKKIKRIKLSDTPFPHAFKSGAVQPIREKSDCSATIQPTHQDLGI